MFKNIFLCIIMIIMFTGCTNKIISLDENLKDNSLTQKEYIGISKDAILEAAKKVFFMGGNKFKDKSKKDNILSYGGKEFRIESYRNKLIVSRTRISNYIFFPSTQEDYWVITVNEVNNKSNVKLEIYSINNFDEDDIEYLEKDLHNVFYERMEYFLGFNDKWDTCFKHFKLFDNLFCSWLFDYNKVKEEDIVENILISDRQNIEKNEEDEADILNEDISLFLNDKKEDILDKKDDSIVFERNDSDKVFDKEIDALNKKVNENIKNTLDKNNEDNLLDEVDKNLDTDNDDKIDNNLLKKKIIKEKTKVNIIENDIIKDDETISQ